MCFIKNKTTDRMLNGDLYLPVEKYIRGGVSGVFRPRYFQKNGRLKILYTDANNLYGWTMIQPLPYGGYECLTISSDETIATADDSEFGYFVDEDLKCTDIFYVLNLKKLTKSFPLTSRRKTKPHNQRPVNNLICDWNEKKYLLHTW